MRGDDNQQERMFSYVRQRSVYQQTIRCDPSPRWWMRF